MKGKEKDEPSAKRRLVLTKNVGPPSPPKRQTTIDESMKKPIEAELISAIKIVEPKEVNEEDGGLIKWERNKQVSRSVPFEGKVQNFLGSRFDKIASEVLEMLPAEVQSTTRVYYKY